MNPQLVATFILIICIPETFHVSSDDNFHCYDTADYTGTITEKVDEGLYDNNAYLPMPLIHHTFKYSRQSEVCALLHLVYNEFCCCCVD